MSDTEPSANSGYETTDVLTAIIETAPLGGSQLLVKLERSPFYPAGGGQVTDQGIVIAANRTSVEGCGLTRDEVIGRPFWECGWWSPDEALAARIRSWCMRCLETGEALRATSCEPCSRKRTAKS